LRATFEGNFIKIVRHCRKYVQNCFCALKLARTLTALKFKKKKKEAVVTAAVLDISSTEFHPKIFE
jgi:hypothetical protein